MDLIQISRALADEVDRLGTPAPAAYVYNPLGYARRPHEAYLERFGGPSREIVLLGMNPGPFGMAQTGVPFGDVVTVREWLGIDEPVGKPPREHPRRPVLGLGCPRVEVSGQRLWGWARQRFGTPESFFARFFVANYCPLVFLEDGGRNLTPDKLPAAAREPLFAACDRALARMVEVLAPEWVIGVGRFARGRAEAALAGSGVRIGEILHPSPASPKANRGWADQAEAQLAALGVHLQ